MTDPFERLAATQISAPRKARLKAAQTRREREREKELNDQVILYKLWQKWHQERREELLAGAWSSAAHVLADFLEHMTMADASTLLSLVERGPWHEADTNTRFLVLSMIDRAIVHLREQHGLTPFDDAIPWLEEPTVFEQLREMLQ